MQVGEFTACKRSISTVLRYATAKERRKVKQGCAFHIRTVHHFYRQQISARFRFTIPHELVCTHFVLTYFIVIVVTKITRNIIIADHRQQQQNQQHRRWSDREREIYCRTASKNRDIILNFANAAMLHKRSQESIFLSDLVLIWMNHLFGTQ